MSAQYLYPFILCCLSFFCRAQSDTASIYPLQVGNRWTYVVGDTTYSVMIKKDTTILNKHYFIEDNSESDDIKYLRKSDARIEAYNEQLTKVTFVIPEFATEGDKLQETDWFCVVRSVNDTLETPANKYYGVMKVVCKHQRTLDAMSMFYKRGIGLVAGMDAQNKLVMYLQEYQLK